MGIRFFKPIIAQNIRRAQLKQLIAWQERMIRVQKMIQTYNSINLQSKKLFAAQEGSFLERVSSSNQNNSVRNNLTCSAWAKDTKNVEIQNYIFSENKEDLIKSWNLIKKQLCKIFPLSFSFVASLFFF